MHTITPFLWFDDKAEEAIDFYMSIFKNGKKTAVARCGDAGPGPKGSVMMVSFELDGQKFHALNGGPHFKFTEAISLFVSCDTQQEIDMLWEKLSAGGQKSQCGWLKDKYGLSWQIVPKSMDEFLRGPDAKKSANAMRAMLKMTKLDIAELRHAYAEG